MKRTRISWFFDFMPKYLKLIPVFLSYLILYALISACFYSITGMTYFLWQGLYGSVDGGWCGTTFYAGYEDAIVVNFLIGIIVSILFLHFVRFRAIVLIGLFIAYTVSLSYARSINEITSLTRQFNSLIPNIIIFIVSLLLIMYLLPVLLKEYKEKNTPVLAKPVEKEIGSKES